MKILGPVKEYLIPFNSVNTKKSCRRGRDLMPGRRVAFAPPGNFADRKSLAGAVRKRRAQLALICFGNTSIAA